MTKFLRWDDLTPAEQEQARESYICIREYEECRDRDDVISNPDYDYPIDGDYVECCKFERDEETGYIWVII